MKVEKAFYVHEADALKGLAGEFSFTRVYFGVEFCEQKLPSLSEAERVFEFCGKRNLKLTLVTPYVTDEGIARVKKLLNGMEKNGGCEIVINDWGVLKMLRESGTRFQIILGRVLTKQKKDPRISGIRSPQLRDYFSKGVVDSPLFCEFLKENRIERVEMDNVPHGISGNSGFHCSLYYPYVYLTTAMQCFVETCEMCERTAFRLRNKSVIGDLLLKGKTQFYVNKDLSAFQSGNIDRIIMQSGLPF